MKHLKLFFAPHTCALAPLIGLEEIGRPFETGLVRLAKGQQSSPDYLKMNPKGKVPTLLVDGEPLTENPVILMWLHETYSEARLLPDAGAGSARHHQMSDLVFIGATLHPAVAHYAMPFRFVTEEADPMAVVRPAAAAALRGLLGKVEQRLSDGPWWYGAQWSIVDAYLHWIWTRLTLIGFGQDAYPNLVRHTDLSAARPAVQRAREIERGYIAALEAEGIYKAPV